MTILIETIKEKISQNLDVEWVSLIDNSSLHKKHKSFDPKKFHLKIIIKSKKLMDMSKIQAHKLVYATLKDELKDTIHALEIEIR